LQGVGTCSARHIQSCASRVHGQLARPLEPLSVCRAGKLVMGPRRVTRLGGPLAAGAAALCSSRAIAGAHRHPVWMHGLVVIGPESAHPRTAVYWRGIRANGGAPCVLEAPSARARRAAGATPASVRAKAPFPTPRRTPPRACDAYGSVCAPWFGKQLKLANESYVVGNSLAHSGRRKLFPKTVPHQ
jgi:hypothetical protein